MTAREMQRRSAEARWSGKTAEERRREMSALAKTRWAKTARKPKRAARLPNCSGSPTGGGKMKEYFMNPVTRKVGVREKQSMSEPPIRVQPVVSPPRRIRIKVTTLWCSPGGARAVRNNAVLVKIEAGEIAEHLSHNDCYVFSGRGGWSPWYDRCLTEKYPEWFEAVEG